MRQAYALFRAVRGIAIQRELGTGSKGNLTVGKLAEAKLWPLQIG
jgi:hypothetical protein